MKLTALDIKQQKFEKVLRGYDTAEVAAFLNVVAAEWEQLSAQNRALQAELEELKQKAQHYSKVEEALHETLHAARENAEQKLALARNEAETKIKKAEIETENMLRDARQQRQEIRQGILRLLDRREEIISGMKGYLDMAKESLESFEKDPSGLFELPSEDRDDDKMSKKTSSKTKAPGLVDVDKLLDGID